MLQHLETPAAYTCNTSDSVNKFSTSEGHLFFSLLSQNLGTVQRETRRLAQLPVEPVAQKAFTEE